MDDAPQSSRRRAFEQIFEPLTREEPQQAHALVVVAYYLIMLRLGSPETGATSDSMHKPAPLGSDGLSAMHTLLFGYRPSDDEASRCHPTEETLQPDCYEEFIDFLEAKQVRRMLTAFAAAIAHLCLCSAPEAALDALEKSSLDGWLVPYEGPPQR